MSKGLRGKGKARVTLCPYLLGLCSCVTAAPSSLAAARQLLPDYLDQWLLRSQRTCALPPDRGARGICDPKECEHRLVDDHSPRRLPSSKQQLPLPDLRAAVVSGRSEETLRHWSARRPGACESQASPRRRGPAGRGP